MAALLRPAILKEISRTLDNTRSHISLYDFDIQHIEGSITIKYKYREGIFLELNFSNELESYTTTKDVHTITGAVTQKQITKSDYSISGRMAPGRLTTFEDFSFFGVDPIKRQIENWVIHIWDDLSADPVVKAAHQTREDLDSFMKQFPFENIVNGEEYYTKQEVEQIKTKLTEVEKTMKEELSRSIEDQELLKKEIADLKKEFDSFRQTVSNFTKKNWIRSTIAKLYIWGSKKENQQLISATARYGEVLIDTVKD